MERYFIIYKPYKMLSQFVCPHKKRLLGDLNFDFPPGTNAVGRLDDNSEGLLILTTDKKMSGTFLLPEKQHKRVYLVQVEKIISPENKEQLAKGVYITTPREGQYLTRPCEVELTTKPDWLTIRGHEFRADLPQTWINLTLTEGKFHQVRKMTAAIGHPTKRLIRTHIEKLSVIGMQPGEVKELNQEEMFTLLNLPFDN
jgi:23S rRNA pseudouridine2457 synthase